MGSRFLAFKPFLDLAQVFPHGHGASVVSHFDLLKILRRNMFRVDDQLKLR